MGWFNVLMTKVIVVSGRKDGRVDLIGFHAADSGSQSVELLGCPESKHQRQFPKQDSRF